MYKGKIFLITAICMIFLMAISSVSAFNFEGDGVTILNPVENNGAIPVNIQDQTTRIFALQINQILNQNLNLSTPAIIGDYVVVLGAGHGLVDGDNIAVIEQNGKANLFFAEVLSVSGNNITLDTQVPHNFTISAVVFEYSNDLTVDGSTTEQVFTITNFFEESVDITRIIFHCLDDVDMDDAKFCSIEDGLERGVVFRKKLISGEYVNYFNVKQNADWKLLAYDLSYDDKAKQGFFGMGSRLTFGGQNKIGAVIRLEPYESIELVVQDDLTSILQGGLMLEGHFTQN